MFAKSIFDENVYNSKREQNLQQKENRKTIQQPFSILSDKTTATLAPIFLSFNKINKNLS